LNNSSSEPLARASRALGKLINRGCRGFL